MIGHTDNSIDIDAEYGFVWHYTNDVERWPELFTEYATAEILERDGKTVRFRLSMHPDENGTVWSWVSERTADIATGHVLAHRVETGPFEYMNISWSYTDVEGGVRMRWVQDFHMKPQAPVDDEGMTEHLNRNTAIQLTRIKGLVEVAADRGVQLKSRGI